MRELHKNEAINRNKTKQQNNGKQYSEKEDVYKQSRSCSNMVIKANKTIVDIGEYEGFRL